VLEETSTYKDARVIRADSMSVEEALTYTTSTGRIFGGWKWR